MKLPSKYAQYQTSSSRSQSFLASILFLLNASSIALPSLSSSQAKIFLCLTRFAKYSFPSLASLVPNPCSNNPLLVRKPQVKLIQKKMRSVVDKAHLVVFDGPLLKITSCVSNPFFILRHGIESYHLLVLSISTNCLHSKP